MPEHVHPSLRDPITHGGQLAPGLRAACGSYAQAGPCSQAGLSGRAELFGGMAADPAQAVDTLVDEIADLEIDEDLLHPASGSVGDSEEEEAARPLRRRPHRPPRPTGAGAGPPRAQARPGKAGVARLGLLPRRQARSIRGSTPAPTPLRRAPSTRARRRGSRRGSSGISTTSPPLTRYSPRWTPPTASTNCER